MDAKNCGISPCDELTDDDGTNSRKSPGISLVLPAYNEREIIQRAIREADDGLATITDDYEILIVDDGSTDDTREVAEQAAQQRPAVRVISLPENRGYGAALRTGFQAARKPWIGFSDADCQFDIRELDRLAMLLNHYEIACGYRIARQDHWLRLLYSRVFNFLVGLLLGVRVRDVDCAFKLFRRSTLQTIMPETDGFLVNAEMLTKARTQDKSVVEVGVTHRERPNDKSTVSVLHSVPVACALLRFWWSAVLFPAGSKSTNLAANGWSSRRVAAGTGLLCVLSGLMLLNNLSYTLIEPDESRYAQIALEMVTSGDYLVPRLAGEPYLDKPPLLYWAGAISYSLFGTNEASARMPSAIAAFFTVLSTFLIGRRIVGDRTAYLGSLMLFLCIGFVLTARFLTMDGLLTLFTTVTILAAFRATTGPKISIGWWSIAAIACGLGIMTKGPVAAVLTLPPLFAAQWLVPDRPRLQFKHWLLFVCVVALITVPWFILMGKYDSNFVAYFFWQHHVMRFVDAFNHREPFWYYIPVLFIGMFPASLLAAPTVAFLASRQSRFRLYRSDQLGFMLIAAVWILLFFSMSKCKLPTYILPALPMLCLTQAAFLSVALDSKWSQLPLPHLTGRIPLHATSIAFSIGGVIAGIDLLLEPDRGFHQILNISMIAVAVIAVVHRITSKRQRSSERSDWAMAATASLLVIAFSFQKFVPELAHHRSINAKVAELHKQKDTDSSPIVFFDWPTDGLAFHMSPEFTSRFDVDEFDELQQFLQQTDQAVVVTKHENAALLQANLADAVEFNQTQGGRGRVFITRLRPKFAVGTRSPETITR